MMMKMMILMIMIMIMLNNDDDDHDDDDDAKIGILQCPVVIKIQLYIELIEGIERFAEDCTTEGIIIPNQDLIFNSRSTSVCITRMAIEQNSKL